MSLTAWVSTKSGLPCFYSTTAGHLYDGKRLVHVFPTGGGLCSDTYAPCGVPTTYRMGALTRTVTRNGDGMGKLILTRINGKPVLGVWLRDIKEPLEYKPLVTVAPSGYARWRLHPHALHGQSVAICWDPNKERALWDILHAHEPLVLMSSAPVPGVEPVRHIVVTNVQRRRITPAGGSEFTVSWRTVPAPDVAAGGSTSAPVVTWGDYAEHVRLAGTPGFRSGDTYVSLASHITGMPS